MRCLGFCVQGIVLKSRRVARVTWFCAQHRAVIVVTGWTARPSSFYSTLYFCLVVNNPLPSDTRFEVNRIVYDGFFFPDVLN
jgi:hypothetical protein